MSGTVFGSLSVLLKCFNEDLSSDDMFLYAMKSDLSLFDRNSMSEVLDAVDFACLTRFAVLGGVVDNSLRFWPVKSCLDLVARLICACNRILKEKSKKN